MLQVTDFRQTRVYQEAHEEGMEKGREEATEAIARRMLESGHTVTEVAKVTGWTAARVRKLTKKPKA